MSDISPAPDRYRSFDGIDCMEQARAVVARILSHVGDPARSNALWERFKTRLAEHAAGKLGAPDELYLVCSHTYYIEDLFTDRDDADGLAMLTRIEEECC